MSDDDISEWTDDVHCGDSKDVLADMPADSVHMAMTSPPYYGLRDYGEDGQIGLEESLDAYIQNLVSVFDELKRVLRPDGSFWLNLGDSYATSPSGNGGRDIGGEAHGDASGNQLDTSKRSMFQQKDKMLVPHRVAMALQESGWLVRNDCVWLKPGGGMPESVTDRLSTSFEFVFHLVPQQNYWYDLDAIRRPPKSEYDGVSWEDRVEAGGTSGTKEEGQTATYGDLSNTAFEPHPSGVNPGDVFEVSTKPFSDAHFAVYPPELCEKPIKASCPPEVCAECGTPHERVVEEERSNYETSDHPERTGGAIDGGTGKNFPDVKRDFQGWEPACDCDTDATEPGIALDPFTGSGTTCMVARQLGRRFVGMDLNPEYVAMAQQRIGMPVSEPEHVRDEGQSGVDAFLGGDGE